jgi:hypothetical protein
MTNVTWNNGRNKLNEGLVASLSILEKKVEELEDDKAARTIKN